ncbi:MAG: hypothetical protein NZM12_07535 [Steroidobacteraceae bacterium]|nr:hypothetical protein [Steroidobacteraceae bacterium]MDW8260814.1 hypothetical protein [Gammaproteobacteria bacterium]
MSSNAAPRPLPARAALRPDGLYVAARMVPPAELRDPFLQQTIARVAGADSIIHIPRERLHDIPAAPQLVGMIFHVARCGSTLVSQALRCWPNVTIYAEPQAFNELLLPPHPWSRAEMIGALRALSAAFAEHAQGPCIVKFTSWNTLFCQLLVDAFPSTPWVLCLRDPIEVSVSLLRQPPAWLRPEEEPARRIAPLFDPRPDASSAEERLARLYGAFCAAIAPLRADRGRLARYDAMPAAIETLVAPHFGLRTSNDAVRRCVAATANAYVKAPIGQPRPFAPDSAAKRAAASAALQQAVARYAQPALEHLLAVHGHLPGQPA